MGIPTAPSGRSPDSRAFRVVSAFPRRPEWRLLETGAGPVILAGLPGHSGATAPDSHRLPFVMARVGHPTARRVYLSPPGASMRVSEVESGLVGLHTRDDTMSDSTTLHLAPARIGIVTSSDRASAGVYEDRSGAAIRETMTAWLASPWEPVYRLIPDERAVLERTLIELADVEGCCLIVTTGGTGPAPRDVTPEATEAVCEKLLPGFGEQMRAASLKFVPTAILSRQTAGIRGRSLIINLPGKPKSITECLEAVFPAIPYCIDLIGGPFLEATAAAPKVFRPKSA